MKDKECIVKFQEGLFNELSMKFIQYKRSSGLKYGNSTEYVIRTINESLNTYDVSYPQMTKQMVEDIVVRKAHESSGTQAIRITILRQFAIFMINMGFEAYVYPIKYVVYNSSSFVPYIFTPNQIQLIFKAADSLEHHHRYPWYHVIYPMLIRILYGCGLRLSEALCLKTQHVDLSNSVLFIEKSKGNTSRLVPISKSLTENCISYIQKMNLDMNNKGYFFPSPDGGKYSRRAVRCQIIKIYATAGIALLKNGLYPRVHDLRHTHAVHVMEKMSKQGYDMYCSMPILSTYLGHKQLSSTEKYLHLTDFKFAEILDLEKKLYAGVIPEVVFDEE